MLQKWKCILILLLHSSLMHMFKALYDQNMWYFVICVCQSCRVLYLSRPQSFLDAISGAMLLFDALIDFRRTSFIAQKLPEILLQKSFCVPFMKNDIYSCYSVIFNILLFRHVSMWTFYLMIPFSWHLLVSGIEPLTHTPCNFRGFYFILNRFCYSL